MATILNQSRSKESPHVFTAEEILGAYYERDLEAEGFDPDLGVQMEGGAEQLLKGNVDG